MPPGRCGCTTNTSGHRGQRGHRHGHHANVPVGGAPTAQSSGWRRNKKKENVWGWSRSVGGRVGILGWLWDREAGSFSPSLPISPSPVMSWLSSLSAPLCAPSDAVLDRGTGRSERRLGDDIRRGKTTPIIIENEKKNQTNATTRTSKRKISSESILFLFSSFVISVNPVAVFLIVAVFVVLGPTILFAWKEKKAWGQEKKMHGRRHHDITCIETKGRNDRLRSPHGRRALRPSGGCLRVSPVGRSADVGGQRKGSRTHH